jgi:hypothetical protein
MPVFLPAFITRNVRWGMADSVIAIPAISHEHFLPAVGSQFPERADLSVADPEAARGVDGVSGSNR